ncbi:MAG: hypothetical protein Q8M17_07925 [Actinomycetota bacterium]|nr:hypothetical protein [Actinomycetota bacterium]
MTGLPAPSRSPRRSARWLGWAIALGAVIAVVIASALVWRSTSSAVPEPAPGPSLSTQVVQAGEIEVTVTPTMASGKAGFALVLDTHSVELDMDLAAAATLTVDGRDAGTASWVGQEPGGHHREGTLNFSADVGDGSILVLRLDGFAEPLEVTWPAP